jgi:DNA-binding response OmpR family regulator
VLVHCSVRSAAWLRNHLEVEGFRVVVAGDGSTALHLIRSESPELLVLCSMDLFADERSDNGVGAAVLDDSQFLRDLRRESSITVIAISRERCAAKTRELPDLSGYQHLTWPFSRHRLMACIRTVLRQANDHGHEEGYVAEACGELSRH